MSRTDGVDAGRREFLARGGGAALLGALVAAGILKPGEAGAAEFDRAAFAAKTLDDAYAALGAKALADGAGVVFEVPDVAENGAIVPVTVSCTVPRTESISILVDENAYPLVATFILPEGTAPWLTTRIKLARTTKVAALVKADGRFLVVTKHVQVTAGGCG